MSPAARPGDGRLILGGSPRADLMPPSVRQDEAARKQRGLLAAVFVGVIVLVGAAYAVTAVVAASSQAQLASANEKTSSLLLEQGKYNEVTDVQTDLDAAKAAVGVGSSTEIDWDTLVTDINKSLPNKAYYTGFDAQVSDVNAIVPQPGSVLYGPRVLSIEFTLVTEGLDDTADFLRDVTDIPGFADILPGTSELKGGFYETTIALNFNTGVFVAAGTDEESNGE